MRDALRYFASLGAAERSLLGAAARATAEGHSLEQMAEHYAQGLRRWLLSMADS
jgi:hypothetical protein